MKIEKKDLTKEVLTYIFGAAAYGTPSCGFYAVKEFIGQLGEVTYDSEGIVEELLHGRKVWYVDFQAKVSDVSNSVSHYDNCSPADEWLQYSATLDEMVERINDVMDGRWVGDGNEEDPRIVMRDIVKIVTDDESAGIFTAWHVVQAAFFGKISYF